MSKILLLILIIFSFLSSCTSVGEEEKPFNYPPSSILLLEFENLPLTLFNKVHEKDIPVLASIFFPENYSPDKKYPLLIWLNGGDGGNGQNTKVPRNVIKDKDFICVNFPLFKSFMEPLEPDSANYWDRMYIGSESGDTIWVSYKIMLQRIIDIVPNIDKENTFMGGFSNGGHTVAVLLNREKAEIMDYFKNFFIIEGGWDMNNFSVLRENSLLVMIGSENSQKEYKKKITNVHLQAKEVGVNSEFFIMEETGHQFPPKYYHVLKEWLYKSLNNSPD